MWVMTPFGILMPALRPPDTVPEGDVQTLQIRTRRRKDLEILRDEYMGEALGEIIHTPTFDYNYRAYCTPQAFSDALGKMTHAIDYERFKPTTEAKYKDAELHSVYNSIWGTVTRLGEPWEGLKFKGTSGSSVGSTVGSTVSRNAGWGWPKYGFEDEPLPVTKPDPKWICATCGSSEVSVECWTYLNEPDTNATYDSYWCDDCDKACKVKLAEPAESVAEGWE